MCLNYEAMTKVFLQVSRREDIHDLLQVSRREDIHDLVQMEQYIDLIIPRGSNTLVRSIQDQSAGISALVRYCRKRYLCC